VAPSGDDDDSPGPTPVPPRRGKRKPNRPTSKRQPGAPVPRSKGGQRAIEARAPPADKRRTARAHQRRRNQTLLLGGAILVIVAVVAIFIGINASGGGGTKTNTATEAVSAATLSKFTSAASPAELKAAATNYGLTGVSGEGPAYPTVISGTPLTTTGKPEILYLGAEYCPYCATERWPLILALSKFGTFHNLTAIHSAGGDEVYPDTPTFSFYKSTYTSAYITFTPVEEETVTHATLQTPTATQDAIASKYDSTGDIPFVYFNGKATITGAEIDPSLLGSGDDGPASKMTFQQIVDDIAAGSSTLSSSVMADAGVIVSDICAMTGGKPGNVCSLFPKPITG
jgi:thiol-disulfide isomerase/thioredoxin